MLNVLYIAPYKYLAPRNGGQYCQFYTHQSLGKKVNLYVAGVESNEIISGNHFELINVFSDSKYRYMNPFYYFKLKKIIKEKNIQVLIIEHPYMAWLAYLVTIFTSLTWIIRSENVEYLRFKSMNKKWWSLLKIYETWAHKKADFVWCITQEDKKQIQQDIKNSSTVLLDFPYCTTLNEMPNDKEICRKNLCNELNIAEDATIILFNGSLNYQPNRIGLDAILNDMNPVLLSQNLNYKIIICGSNLPKEYNELKDFADKNIIYKGFVDDISIYFKGTDIFLNPVIGGGGIKTKLVEALAFNTTSISSEDGAVGLYTFATGNKLHLIKDLDWSAFTSKIIELINNPIKENIPQKYYEYYGWSENVSKLLSAVKIKK